MENKKRKKNERERITLYFLYFWQTLNPYNTIYIYI